MRGDGHCFLVFDIQRLHITQTYLISCAGLPFAFIRGFFPEGILWTARL